MAVTIMQGDSWPIYMNIIQNGTVLVPDMLDDLEICVGSDLGYYLSKDTVKFDIPTKRWYIWPTQAETFALEPGSHKVEIRAKYKNQNQNFVKGNPAPDKIKVIEASSREVL